LHQKTKTGLGDLTGLHKNQLCLGKGGIFH